MSSFIFAYHRSYSYDNPFFDYERCPSPLQYLLKEADCIIRLTVLVVLKSHTCQTPTCAVVLSSVPFHLFTYDLPSATYLNAISVTQTYNTIFFIKIQSIAHTEYKCISSQLSSSVLSSRKFQHLLHNFLRECFPRYQIS